MTAWELMARKNPYFDKTNATSLAIMFGVVNGTWRPKKFANCPPILELFFERGMDGDPKKRPTIQFIVKLLRNFDKLINKEPIKPILIDENTAESTQAEIPAKIPAEIPTVLKEDIIENNVTNVFDNEGYLTIIPNIVIRSSSRRKGVIFESNESIESASEEEKELNVKNKKKNFNLCSVG